MENSYKFFSNLKCKYYPCHKGIKEINCLFCYCPLYNDKSCGGNAKYISDKNGNLIKDCSECTFVHEYKNYDYIIKKLAR